MTTDGFNWTVTANAEQMPKTKTDIGFWVDIGAMNALNAFDFLIHRITSPIPYFATVLKMAHNALILLLERFQPPYW